jgi:low affinity Fe/Cu permease
MLFEKPFTKAANHVAYATGTPLAFMICCTVVVMWAMTGPVFGFSDTWQLIINTGTTIVTFLMVFLIQNTQNRDGAAIQAKLDELIRVSKGHNHFIGIEHLTETEVEEFRAKCERAAKQHNRKERTVGREQEKKKEKKQRTKATAGQSMAVVPAGRSQSS